MILLCPQKRLVTAYFRTCLFQSYLSISLNPQRTFLSACCSQLQSFEGRSATMSHASDTERSDQVGPTYPPQMSKFASQQSVDSHLSTSQSFQQYCYSSHSDGLHLCSLSLTMLAGCWALVCQKWLTKLIWAVCLGKCPPSRYYLIFKLFLS